MGRSIDALDFLGAAERRHLEVIAADLRLRSTVLFCGAGLSFNARRKDGSNRPLPGWWKLTAELARELPGVLESDPALRVADLYESTFGRTRLIERLQELIPDREYEPGDVHTLIPLMGFREIITTNFDTLIERAYRDLRVNPKVVISGSDLVSSRPPRVIKLNGCFDRNPHGVVITGEDFRRYDGERPLLVSFLTNCFVESLVLFVGFSLDDPAFREIFGRVRDILGRNVRISYSIQGPVPPAQIGFWEARGLNILSLYSGAPREDLTFQDRLRLVLHALLEEARRDVFTPSPLEPVEAAARGFVGHPFLQGLRGWLWEAPASTPPAEPAPDPLAPPPASPSTRWQQVVALAADHPRLALVSLLPPTAWDRLAPGGEPSAGLLDALLDRPGAASFSLTELERRSLRSAIDFLKHASGAGITWQRSVARLLGELLEERYHPLRSPAGVFALPWARQVVQALAESLEPREPDAGRGAPTLLADVPGLLLQIALLSWVEEADAAQPAAQVARERVRRARAWLDVRCLATPDAARQREAAGLLTWFGALEDIGLALTTLDQLPRSPAHTRHLISRAAVWTPMRPQSAPPPTEADSAARAVDLESTRAEQARDAAELAARIRDLAPDFRFRFMAFHRDVAGLQDLYGTALDWIREQVFGDVAPDDDVHKLNLVYRHHYLYQDFGAQSRGQMDWPFHRQVQDQLVALYERSESRRSHKGSIHSQVRELFHELLIRSERGKALHVDPPRILETLWRVAGEALSSRQRQPVPWELLIHLSLPADGPAFIERRGELVVEVVERELLDVSFLCDLWLQRLRGGALGANPGGGIDGPPMEDTGGFQRSLVGLAGLLRLLAERREWDPEADAGLLGMMVELVGLLLEHHQEHSHVRTHAVATLAVLSRLAPPRATEPVVERWMSRGTQASAHTSLGLGELDWARLLEHAVAAPGARRPASFHLTRQLLARAMGPIERRADLGRDLNRWALLIYSLDRRSAAPEAPPRPGATRFVLPEDVRLLIQDHFSQLIAEEARQQSLAWLELAGSVRAARMRVNPQVLFGDTLPTTDDPLAAFLLRWFEGLLAVPRMLRDWHWTLSSCLIYLEAFLPSTPDGWRADAPGARLAAVVAEHLDPIPGGAPGAPFTRLDPGRWDPKRRNAVASWLAVCLDGCRGAAPPFSREEALAFLHRLLVGGATGDGAVGRVADLLDSSGRSAVERNLRTAVLIGNPQQQADAVIRAGVFLEHCRRLTSPPPPFEALEAQLIQSAAGVARPRKDRALQWLERRLASPDAAAFFARHEQSLEVLALALEGTERPRPPRAAQRVLRHLQAALR